MTTASSSRIDPYNLRLFVSMASEGSIVRGAEKENIATSALSRRINDLEHAFGTALVVRSPKGVVLTEAGHLVFRHGIKINQDLLKLVREVQQLGGEITGEIRLYANLSAVIGFIPERIETFKNSYPNVQIKLHEHDTRDVIRACLDDRADIGGGVTSEVPTGIDAWHFADDPLMVVTRPDHALAKQKVVTFPEVMQHRLVRVRSGGALDIVMQESADRLGLNVETAVAVSSFDASCRMVEAGLGVAVIPRSAASAYAGSLKFTRIPLDEPWAQRSLSVYALKKQPRLKAVQLLIDALTNR